MRLALFGAGEKSIKAKSLIERDTNNEVCYFIEDSAFGKIGSILDGIPVISIYSMKRLYEEKQIEKIFITTEYHKRTVEEIVSCCKKSGIDDEDINLLYINFLRGESVENEKEIYAPYNEHIQIFNLNFHLTDHCNMNCAQCCHSAQFVKEEYYASIEKYKKDISRLSELIPNIGLISLIGGEPLLHPNVSEFFETTRKVYPFADIEMVTNGILLESMSKDVLTAIKENDIRVNISLYPPMHTKLDDYLAFFRANEIKGKINRVEEFFRKYSETARFNAKEMSTYCGYCTGFREGKLARCIDSMTIFYANSYFGTNISEPEVIDIYDKDVTGKKIVSFLERPVSTCSFCANRQTVSELNPWKGLSEKTAREDFFYS